MIEQATIQFLKNLKKNNNKEWFDANREAYEIARTNFKAFVDEVIGGISKFDPAIKNLEAKHCVFRINRDIRFSADKTPYKKNMSALIAPGGKKTFLAGYYLHIEPGASFLAGGMWQPEPAHLNAIRQEIDYNANEFKKIINAKSFKNYFDSLSDEDKLKTVPKGYDKTHPQIELLKHRSFIVSHEMVDKTILSKDFLKESTKIFQAMQPLNFFLRRACD